MIRTSNGQSPLWSTHELVMLLPSIRGKVRHVRRMWGRMSSPTPEPVGRHRQGGIHGRCGWEINFVKKSVSTHAGVYHPRTVPAEEFCIPSAVLLYAERFVRLGPKPRLSQVSRTPPAAHVLYGQWPEGTSNAACSGTHFVRKAALSCQRSIPRLPHTTGYHGRTGQRADVLLPLWYQTYRPAPNRFL